MSARDGQVVACSQLFPELLLEEVGTDLLGVTHGCLISVYQWHSLLWLARGQLVASMKSETDVIKIMRKNEWIN